MYPHYAQSIQNATDYFQRDSEVLALLLGGSISHGFESPITERIKRFYAQFEAWHYYSHEALRLGNRYLLGTS